jgi:hypothetical protein
MQIIDLKKPSISESTPNEFEVTIDGLYECKINFEDKDQKENY